MGNLIKGQELPLEKIFCDDYAFRVPNYQRPYSWTVEHADELFSDLFEFYSDKNRDEDETYFLGSIVIEKKENEPLSNIIDGQQRLTTLTILLSVLASFFEDTGKREKCKQYIKSPGNQFTKIESKPRIVLREKDQGFFEQYIQSFEENKKENKNEKQDSKIPRNHNKRLEDLKSLDLEIWCDTDSKKNIKKNCEFFMEQFESKFRNDDDLLEFGSFVLTKCFLIVVSTPSKNSAFRIFSVLNNRGMNLFPSDIIKSEVIGAIDAKNEVSYSGRWEEIETSLGRDEFNDLFGHIRMIFIKEKARRSILKDFCEEILKKYESMEKFFDEIIDPYSDVYKIIKNQNYQSENKDDNEKINSLFAWLISTDNSDWMPIAIEYVSKNMNDSKKILNFLKNLERLAAYMLICSKNVSTRIDRYAKVLKHIEKVKEMTGSRNPIFLTKKEKEEFINVLDGEIYTMPAKKRVYVLLRLDSFIGDGEASYKMKSVTVEHVLPQTMNNEWKNIWKEEEDREYCLNRIANLVILTRKRNAKAQNYDFEKKKNAYFAGENGVTSFALTSQVTNIDSWTPEVVKQRQKDLIKVFRDNWGLNDSAQEAPVKASPAHARKARGKKS